MTPVIAPVRTDDQRMAALERANRIRIDRAKLKRCLKDGSISGLDVIDDPEDYAAGMKVLTLLTSLPKFGPTKARDLLRQLMISDVKTIGGLSDRQRKVLLDRLYERGVR